MEVKEPSAKYLARSGYKQTEVGVIPEDWGAPKVESIIREISMGPFGSDIKVSNFTSEGVPVLSGGNVGAERLKDSFENFVTPAKAKSLKKAVAHRGDLVVTHRGTLGQISYIPVDSAFDCYVISQSQFRVRFNDDLVAPAWVALYFRSEQGAKSLLEGKGHTGVPAIAQPTKTFRNLVIPLPPLSAQRAIAEALSDADGFIESLEQLLAKKRHLKQGTMQQLLLPKPGDKIRLLGEVSSLKGRIGWQGLKQAEFTANDDEPFLITGMNFKDGAIRWNEVYHISEARYEMAPEIQLRPHDVLMTKDGTIGKVLYIDSIPYPGKASLNSHLLLFRPIKGSYHPKYLYYQLGSKRFKDFVELTKSGTTFFGLSQTAVAGYPVILPPLTEQVRIASVLADMDADIAELEAKLAKSCRIKQGMMQELLTGRIRLVQPTQGSSR